MSRPSCSRSSQGSPAPQQLARTEPARLVRPVLLLPPAPRPVRRPPVEPSILRLPCSPRTMKRRRRSPRHSSSIRRPRKEVEVLDDFLFYFDYFDYFVIFIYHFVYTPHDVCFVRNSIIGRA